MSTLPSFAHRYCHAAATARYARMVRYAHAQPIICSMYSNAAAMHYASFRGLISGARLHGGMVASGLPEDVLRVIWGACDADGVGALDYTRVGLVFGACSLVVHALDTLVAWLIFRSPTRSNATALSPARVHLTQGVVTTQPLANTHDTFSLACTLQG
jgi:hypothetical protein